MAVATTPPGLYYDVRRFLVPFGLSMGTITLIAFTARPPAFVLILMALVLPVYLVVDWTVLLRLCHQFEHQFVGLLQSNDVDGLKALLARSRLLRWMAPPSYIDVKRGLIALLDEDWPAALAHFERAERLTPAAFRAPLLPLLVRVKYENGLWDEAEALSRELVGTTDYPTSAELFLGLILVRRPEERAQGVRLLEAAAESLGGRDKARAEAALAEVRQEGRT